MEVNKTKEFVHYMAVLKEIEINYYKNKIFNLNELIQQNPDNLIFKIKHQMALKRFKKLKKTFDDLKRLKKELKKI
ncbi:MAG: hypothetical protein GW839_12595 [Flavobacteriales bacterium]|nr:hypothetical protein [Flavobacteriia bacterium]NCP06283.1 hypothetical protein [Flavobacteriales bacterium]PIV95136.1 MAG: hypothetical protein COW44_00510 [Flavobacteriaceae bacterium CG17_big_fil_post_rev_8_21_14_2_50_33_15]PIY13399.1 MAG: hypothetical protein COZ17_00780 [Flavobacteriaceae bacterium CG_4_10_14_3_um_filter_33_47]PJB19726.1 MAG: hypothetical protein CO117_03625 [Flavobacteriaceae bacterium CG_4_9_14_3_um_filter_33_16]